MPLLPTITISRSWGCDVDMTDPLFFHEGWDLSLGGGHGDGRSVQIKERRFQFRSVNVTLSVLLVKKKTVKTEGETCYWNVGNQGFEGFVICMERIKKNV